MKTRSLNISNGLIARSVIFTTANNNGTVNGAIRDVTITMFSENAIFPLTISVKVGDATPAGMEVRRRIATASFGLNRFMEKKNIRGMISM